MVLQHSPPPFFCLAHPRAATVTECDTPALLGLRRVVQHKLHLWLTAKSAAAQRPRPPPPHSLCCMCTCTLLAYGSHAYHTDEGRYETPPFQSSMHSPTPPLYLRMMPLSLSCFNAAQAHHPTSSFASSATHIITRSSFGRRCSFASRHHASSLPYAISPRTVVACAGAPPPPSPTYRALALAASTPTLKSGVTPTLTPTRSPSQFPTRLPTPHHQPHVLHLLLPSPCRLLRLNHRRPPPPLARSRGIPLLQCKWHLPLRNPRLPPPPSHTTGTPTQALSSCSAPAPASAPAAPLCFTLIFLLLLTHACRRLLECARVHVWTQVPARAFGFVAGRLQLISTFPSPAPG